jgi:[acyl-carrier-protein] S-malonyltransferase
MSDAVLLFSGQGAQKVGMGKDLAEQSRSAADLIREADRILGFSLSQVMFEGPDDELTRTSRCQPALYVHSLMALAMLRERVPSVRPVAAAGLSLGEFTAHAAAGTFSFEQGLRLVGRRGSLMEEACKATAGSMAAMIGGEEEDVAKLAAQCDVDVANLNAPGQIVLSGTIAGIDAAVTRAKDFGVRKAIKLNVAGAYHSRLMSPAREALARELSAADLNGPSIPVVCNVSARPEADPPEIRRLLAEQVTGTVRWSESIRHLRDQGHRLFIELGPGKVLAGLVAKIDRDAIIHSVETTADLDALAAALGG